MGDRITVTYGQVSGINGVNAYHQAIVTYSNGKITVTQAGPQYHPRYETALAAIDVLGATIGAPWGTITATIDKEVGIGTEQTTLDSSQVISGKNLYDLGKILSYNASLIQNAGLPYSPNWQNSNSFVGTLLGSVGLSIEATHWSPAADVRLDVPGLINIGVDAAGQVDHGFHQTQPSAPQARPASTPVAGISSTGMRSEATEQARATEAARQAGVARTSNVSGYGGYRSEGPMAEAAQRAGMTGGRFPGKDQDDRDMARPDAKSNTQYSPDSGFLGGLQVGPSQKQYSTPKAYDFTKTQVYSYTKYTSVTKTYKAPDISQDFAAFDPNKPQVYSPPGFKYTSVVTTEVTKVVTKVTVPKPPKQIVNLPQFAPPPTPAPRNFFEQFASWLSGNGSPGASERSLGVARDAMARGATPSQAKALAHKDAQASGFDTNDPGWNAALDRTTGTSWGGGNGGGTRGSGSTGRGSSGLGGGVGAVGDHAGNNRGNDNSRGNGWNGHPVLLDLTGNGLNIDGLGSSSRFVDLAGDGYEHRTAWAGEGNGVLVFDADGDGKISRSSEFIFTEWDKSETSDLRALKKVFDSNGNGKLDAGDARWADFKVMVGDQLVSLDSLGIVSIDLTPSGTGQSFEDGSAITGTTTYTKTDGTIGQVGDAVLAGDANGYTLRRSKTVNPDASTTEDLLGFSKDGSLAFRNLIVTSADGSHKETKFDDDGNGTFDRSQTVDVAVGADATRTRIVANFNADGSLRNKTTTTTSPDRKTVTTLIDQDGDGQNDQSQIFVTNADGSTSTTVKQFAVNGALLKQTESTSSADGLTKITRLDETGSGVFNLITTEQTVIAADGSRTKTVTQTSANGTPISRVITATSADGRSEAIEYDRAGSGVFDEKELSVTGTSADGSVTNTVTSYNADGSLRGKTIATTSANGLTHTLAEDLNSDGITDRTTTNGTIVAADGSRTQTVEQRSSNGSLISSQITSTSADRKTIAVSADINGDGAIDQTNSIAVDANGATRSIISRFNADGSLIGRTQSESSADGLTQTIDEDLDGNGIFDRTTSDVTVLNADGSRTQTLQNYSRGGATSGISLGTVTTTVSQDSLTKTVRSDLDGDGIVDREVVDAIALDFNGSRTETVTSSSGNGTKLSQTVTTISADRKTTSIQEDLNGDGVVDRSTIAAIDAGGGKVTTTTGFASDGSVVHKSSTETSGNGFTSTERVDLNGDGYNDRTRFEDTAIGTDGVRTTTFKEWSGTTLISTAVAGVSANGLQKTKLNDLDGDGTFDTKDDDFTSYNSDGSTTRTITHSVGSSTVANRKVITTSANGLSVKEANDLDGDGNYDRTTTDVKQLNNDGSTIEWVEEWSGNNTKLSRTTVTVSADRKTTTTEVDADANGTIDSSKSVVLGANGVTTTTEKSFSPGGILISARQTAASANGLTTTVKEDWNGDGAFEQVTASTTVINDDGSQTETVAVTSANGSLMPGKVTTTTSASGLSTIEQVDLNGDGVSDRTTSSMKTLAADGSESLVVEVRTSNGTLLSRSAETTSADRKTRLSTYDDNGDGSTDRTTTVAINANGSTSTTAIESAANGTIIAKAVTEVSADGLTTTIREDLDGNGTIDTVTVDRTTIGADGKRTRLVTEQVGSGAPVLVSQSIISANGYEKTTQSYDRGWLASGKTEKSVFNSDGSITTTITNVAGAQATLVDKTIKTVSANGLSTTIAIDTDGNGTVDRTSTSTAQYASSGVVIDSTTVKNGSGGLVSTSTTTTSADKRTIEVKDDLDGDGVDDEKTVTSVNGDGSVTSTTTTFATPQDARHVASSSSKTVSADGFTTTISTDADGNGTADRKIEQKVVYATDGSKTETWSAFNAQGTVTEKTVVVSSANGLAATTTWMATGGAVTRSMSDVTTLEADGGKTRTITYNKTGGALESRTITTVAGNGLTTTVTKDINGNGVIDQKTIRVVNADGSVTTTYLDLGGDGILVTGKRAVTESANGLSTTTDFDMNGDGTVDFRTVEVTVLNSDGSKTTTVTRYRGTSQAMERTVILVSADGKIRTESYDLNADGSVDKKQTYSTAFGAHSGYADALTNTIENVVGTSVKSRYQTSTSADGKSTTQEWDIDGNGTVDQTATDISTITDQGTVRSVTAYAGGNKISSTTTTTSNDGRTVTVVEERPQLGFSNRTITTNVATLADGSTVESKTLSNTTSGVVEKQVTKTSGDGRQVTIERDIDGNGTVDQVEQRTKFVDGTTKTVVTGYNSYDKTTFTSSADGLSSSIEWDMDMDGAVDRRRTITNDVKADGSRITVAMDYKVVAGSADTRVRISSIQTSADGRTTTTGLDTNGDGTFDQLAMTTMDASGGSVATMTNNAEAQKVENIVSGEIYWKQAIAAKIVTTVSSDGLTTTEQSDYDGNGTFEVSAMSQTRIDGSVITEYTEVNASGAIVAKGTLTVSNDGRTKILNKDTNNDGFYDHGEKTELFIEGQIVYSTADYNSNGTLKQHTAASILANGNLAHSYVWDGANHKTEEYIRSNDGSGIKYTFVGADEATRSVHTLNKDGKLTSGVFYDPKGTDLWYRIDQIFNADGKKTLEKQFMDDGTSVYITYDPTTEKQTLAKTYDNASRLIAEAGYTNGILAINTLLDPSNAKPWSRVEQVYTNDGTKVRLEKQFMDDGTRVDIEFDTANNQTWQTYSSYYDTALRTTLTVILYDNNTKNLTYYDPSNTKIWTNIFEHHNAQGQVTDSSQLNDDGTRVNTTFDVANTQTWASNTERYDAAGRNVYGELVFDDGSKYLEHRDPANAQTWRLIAENYNAAGQITAQTQYNDDGSRWSISWDRANTQTWSYAVNYYDTAGRYIQQTLVYDNGTRRDEYIDAVNAAAWSNIYEHRDTAGRVESVYQYNDNGTKVIIGYDTTSSQPWTWNATYFNASGGVTNYEVKYDDGTRYYDYRDITNVAAWSTITENYNASNQITYQRRNNDDGSFSASSFDATNVYSWTNYTAFYNASSQCYQEVYNYDNGVRTDIWQGALVGQSYKTYQQDSLADGRVTYTKLTNYNNTYTTTQYDAYGQYNWTRWERFYSSDNVLMSDKIYYDNGAVGTTTGPIGGGGGHRPVVLDLNNDGGIDVRPLAAETDQSGPRFDWNGDGLSDQTSWADANDGFLTIDLAVDGSAGPDGQIDQAKELAFNLWLKGENGDPSHASDLEALRLAFDTNNDQVFDNNDARWSEFRIWQDANQNGITDTGELKTLADAGVTAIGLIPDPVGAVAFADGSEITGTSWFASTDGTRHLVGDVTLVSRVAEPNGPAPLVAADRAGSSMPANVKVDNLIAAMASFGADTGAASIELQNSGETTEPWKQGQLAASSAVWNAA